MKKVKKKVILSKNNDVLPFGIHDVVQVLYDTKWFSIIDIRGVILNANKNSGYPFKVKLEDEHGKPINLGHDDKGGSPGTGPFVYCRNENLTIVTKYIPKRLDGVVKNNWRVGDRFMSKAGFCIDQDNDDDRTGVSEQMVKDAKGIVMTIAAIINRCGVDWILDSHGNYMWLKTWINCVDTK